MNKFVCPMHPEVTSDKPGLCPKCGMSLVMRAMGDSPMPFWEKLKIGMSMTMGMEHTGPEGRKMARLMEEDIKNKFFFSLILTLPILAYTIGETIFGWMLPTPIPKPWLLFLLTTPVFFYGGWLFLYSSYFELKTKKLGMSVLIAVGISAAYLFSLALTILGSQESFYEASVMLITFVLFGHWMEMRSRRGTTDALQALFNLIPSQARVFRNNKEELVPTSQIELGDILIVKPGDKVPVDGKIIEGDTSIDESLVTGESIPVLKKTGDEIIGGSMNTSGFIKFKATKIGDETVLAQIVKMVETAQNSKAPGQKLADKFAKYLVIVAIGAGLITFSVWFFIVGQPLLLALTFAISAIVIACPDALGLATPTAVAVGTGLGAKHNILIKNAPTLEQISKIQTIVLDKTGTLTEGKPKIVDVATASEYTEDGVLQLVASAEAKSSHPLAGAILTELIERKLELLKNVEKFENIAGLGIKAIVDNKRLLIGTSKLMKENNIEISSSLQKKINQFLEKGDTLMILAVGNKAVGVIGAADPIKQTAKIAVRKLESLGIEVVMITGDNKATAESVAKKLGIKRFFAEVLPEEKSHYVKQLQTEDKFTAMVGDGVNDAPALAQADIGIAIGAGTDVAIETADVVLMKSDPLDILRAIKLSKATVTKMKQNLFWASIYNLLAIPVAAGVLYPKFGIELRPEFAALFMSISSIIVAVNAVSLKRVEKDLARI